MPGREPRLEHDTRRSVAGRASLVAFVLLLAGCGLVGRHGGCWPESDGPIGTLSDLYEAEVVFTGQVTPLTVDDEIHTDSWDPVRVTVEQPLAIAEDAGFPGYIVESNTVTVYAFPSEGLVEGHRYTFYAVGTQLTGGGPGVFLADFAVDLASDSYSIDGPTIDLEIERATASTGGSVNDAVYAIYSEQRSGKEDGWPVGFPSTGPVSDAAFADPWDGPTRCTD